MESVQEMFIKIRLNPNLIWGSVANVDLQNMFKYRIKSEERIAFRLCLSDSSPSGSYLALIDWDQHKVYNYSNH
jgi:hypothetical protein